MNIFDEFFSVFIKIHHITPGLSNRRSHLHWSAQVSAFPQRCSELLSTLNHSKNKRSFAIHRKAFHLCFLKRPFFSLPWRSFVFHKANSFVYCIQFLRQVFYCKMEVFYPVFYPAGFIIFVT